MAIAMETAEEPKLRCPHKGCSVAEVGGIVICGTHGWSSRYDAIMAEIARYERPQPATVIQFPVRREIAA